MLKKSMIKDITKLLVIAFLFTLNANAEQPYLKFNVSKLKTDYITQDGINYKDVYADEYDVYSLIGGYEFNEIFFEGRYFWSSEESKSGSATVGAVTVSGSTDVEIDGFSIGGGYNFNINENLRFKPSIHYVEVDVDANLNLTIAGSSFTFDAGGSDETIEGKMAIEYFVNDKIDFALNYSEYLDDITTTKDASTLGLEFKYKF
jgi:hypothetical protein